jgi:hypothetical protein
MQNQLVPEKVPNVRARVLFATSRSSVWWVSPPPFLRRESLPSAHRHLAPVLHPLRAFGPPGLRSRERLPKSALARRCPGWPVRSALRSSRPPASSCTAPACSSYCSDPAAVESCCSCLFFLANPVPTASNQYQFVRCPWLASHAVHFWLIQVRLPLFFWLSILVRLPLINTCFEFEQEHWGKQEINSSIASVKW